MATERASDTSLPPPSETAIVGRLLESDRGEFSPEAARAILRIRFGERDQQRMHELARKNQGGTLTGEEQAEMEGYRRVGYLLAALWSKARTSLKAAGTDANGHDA